MKFRAVRLAVFEDVHQRFLRYPEHRHLRLVWDVGAIAPRTKPDLDAATLAHAECKRFKRLLQPKARQFWRVEQIADASHLRLSRAPGCLA